MFMSVNIEGGEALLAILARGPVAVKELPQATFIEASSAFAQSQFQCPVETGMLRASGHVKPPSVDSNGVSVDIAYGGAAAPYAIYVHERLDVSHDPPTKAKFLEDPVTQAAPQFAARIAKTIESALGV